MKRVNKSAELYSKYQGIIVRLIDNLWTIDMLDLEHWDTGYNIVKQIYYINECSLTINKLDFLITGDDARWHDFKNEMQKHGIVETELMRIYVELLINFMLMNFELLKTMLLHFLKKKKYKQTKITGKEPLGLLLDRLDQILPNQGLSDCINKELRNALAHFWYWVQGEKFYYCNNAALSNPKQLGATELLLEFHKLNMLTKCFGEMAPARARVWLDETRKNKR